MKLYRRALRRRNLSKNSEPGKHAARLSVKLSLSEATIIASYQKSKKFAPLGPRLDIGRDQSKLSGAFSFLRELGLSSQIEQFIEELLRSGNDSRVAPIHRAREDKGHQVATDVGIG